MNHSCICTQIKLIYRESLVLSNFKQKSEKQKQDSIGLHFNVKVPIPISNNSKFN